MKSLAVKLHRFLKSEDGPTAVEYAIMLSLIVVVCLSAISTIGINANHQFPEIAFSCSSRESNILQRRRQCSASSEASDREKPLFAFRSWLEPVRR